MESFGPFAFSSVLVPEGQCLRYAFRRAWFSGIPLPRGISPKVNGRVIAGKSGWHVEAHVTAPILSEIVRYEEWVEFE